MGVTTLVVVLLAQGPSLTPVRRVEPGVSVVAGGVLEAAIAANDTQALVLWTDARRRNGFTPEVGSSGPADLWFTRLQLASVSSGVPLDVPSRLLCQADPEVDFSGLSVTRAPGGFVVAWRSEHRGGRFRALRTARINDDGSFSAPCGSEVLSLSDGGTLGPPALATAGGKVLLAYVSNEGVWRWPLSVSSGQPTVTTPALATPQPAPRGADVSLIGRSDGGFTAGWVQREPDGGATARAGPVHVGTTTGDVLSGQARWVRLVEAEPFPVALLVTAPNDGVSVLQLGTIPVTPTALPLSSGGLPLGAAVGSSLLAASPVTGESVSFSFPVSPMSPVAIFSQGYEPLALTSVPGNALRFAARRQSDGALVIFISPLDGSRPDEAVSLRTPPQLAPSLAFSSDAGWLVGWREDGTTGPGRLAVLGAGGQWVGTPTGFAMAPPYLRLGSNTAGTRAGYLGEAFTGTLPEPKLYTLGADGQAGSLLVPQKLLGARSLVVGDVQSLLWRRPENAAAVVHGTELTSRETSLVMSSLVTAGAMGRCAAQAAGALWLPLFDPGGALVFLRAEDTSTVGSLSVVSTGELTPVASSTDLTRSRPCAVAQGGLIGVTWDEGSILQVILFDPVARTSTRRSSVLKSTLEVFPVIAPFEGGWLVATESNLPPVSIQGRLFTPDLQSFTTLTLSNDGTPQLESRGPQVQAGPPGAVAIAWNAFNPVTGAVELRVRTLQAPPGGVSWNVDGGALDAGVDSGVADGGSLDAGGPEDAGADAGTPDAGERDGGFSDGGASDAGVADAGVLDPAPVVFSSCACASAWDASVFMLALGLLARRRSVRR